MRDENIKKAFIEYLQHSNDERFFQALTNFCQIPYIGAASDPNGENFTDLWHVEADKIVDWVGKEVIKAKDNNTL